jgi:hypothetical protein
MTAQANDGNSLGYAPNTWNASRILLPGIRQEPVGFQDISLYTPTGTAITSPATIPLTVNRTIYPPGGVPFVLDYPASINIATAPLDAGTFDVQVFGTDGHGRPIFSYGPTTVVDGFPAETPHFKTVERIEVTAVNIPVSMVATVGLSLGLPFVTFVTNPETSLFLTGNYYFGATGWVAGIGTLSVQTAVPLQTGGTVTHTLYMPNVAQPFAVAGRRYRIAYHVSNLESVDA